jgi:CubicO group peptidase (beta-lactamase class C family)
MEDPNPGHSMPISRALMVSCLLALPGAALAQGRTLSAAQRRQVDSAMTQYLHDRHAPGGSVAIGLDGRVVYAKGYGMADLEHAVPVTTDTRFQSASTLKAVTAAAVLTLVDAHRLDLDAPIQRYCPAFPAKAFVVTARLLLAHQGGIRPSRGADVFNHDHLATVNEAVARFAADTLVAEPGMRDVYTNEGYVLLACAIEGASGRAYADYVHDAILAPAGMTSTVVDDYYAVIPNRSRSYIVRTADNTRAWQGLWTPAHLASTTIDQPANADAADPSWGYGAGNYVTTPTDLVRLAIAWQGPALLSDSLRAQALLNHPTRDGAAPGRPWGWLMGSIDSAASPRVIGSNWTGSSAIVTVPAWGVAVSVSSNIEFEQPSSLVDGIARIVAGRPRR